MTMRVSASAVLAKATSSKKAKEMNLNVLNLVESMVEIIVEDPVKIIDVQNLIKRVTTSEAELTILDNINFTVLQGESVAIVGASGSGKSTLLSLLAGLDLPTEGSISLDGQLLQDMDEEARAALRGESVGFIFQSFMLVQSLTALENVMLPAELAGLSDAKELALSWLDKVGLKSRANHFPNQLSGGEQQRVAIARAFITQPKILFADEPSANLDSKNGTMIENLLFELNRAVGSTLILVTHDQQLALRCQRLLRMVDGQITDESESSLVS